MQTKVSKCHPLAIKGKGGHPEKEVNVGAIFRAIRSNKEIKDKIKGVREAHATGKKVLKTKLKKTLPSIVVSATFKSKRQEVDIKEFTGLTVMDFDHVEDIPAFKKKLAGCKIVFAAFVSPSGDGVKAIIRTPAVKDKESHVGTWLSLKEFFNSKFLDESGKDFTRLCYLTHDPDIYVNEEAEVWTQKVTQKKGSAKSSPPRPDVEIERREETILGELRKIDATLFEDFSTNRNNTTMKRAAMFCDYGISKDVAIDIIRKNVQDWKDFKENEFKKAVSQGFKKAEAGSKTITKRPEIPNSFSRGSSRPKLDPLPEPTVRKVDGLDQTVIPDADEAEEIDASSSFSRGSVKRDKVKPKKADKRTKKSAKGNVESMVDEANDPIFWYFVTTGKDDKKKTTLTLDMIDVLDWLAYFGYASAKKGEDAKLVRIVENVVEVVTPWDIKHFILNWLDELHEAVNKKAKSEIKAVKRLYLSKPSFAEMKNLSGLRPVEITKLRDEKTSSRIFYDNCVATIAKDSVTYSKYTELDAPIWREELNGRTISKKAPKGAGHYEQFIGHVADLGEDTAEHNKLAFETAIGYLVHGYKSSSTTKIITTNDSQISLEGVSSGRSGKGLFGKSLGHIRSRYEISGKTIKSDDKFWLQGVQPYHQIVNFEDMARKFNFESLYNLTTDDWTIEQKYQPAIQIPSHESPKLIVSTNFTISALDPSTIDRIHNLEFSTHYHAGVRGQKDHRPEDDFGCQLFYDWTGENAQQWEYYDHYIINCLQKYLTHGLIPAKTKNLHRRQLINAVGMSLVEWLEDAVENEIILFDIKTANIVVHEQYVNWCNRNNIERFDRDQRSFTSKMYRYFRDSGWDVKTGDNVKVQTNNGRVRGFIVSKTTAVEEEEITAEEFPKQADDSIRKVF